MPESGIRGVLLGGEMCVANLANGIFAQHLTGLVFGRPVDRVVVFQEEEIVDQHEGVKESGRHVGFE
ncbi:MAG: hypothetical protein ACYDA6_09785 [Solirubrobacteraceae bacterium]